MAQGIPHRRAWAIRLTDPVPSYWVDVVRIRLFHQLHGGARIEADTFLLTRWNVRRFLKELRRPGRGYGHYNFQVRRLKKDRVWITSDVGWGLAWVRDAVDRIGVSVYHDCPKCRHVYVPLGLAPMCLACTNGVPLQRPT